MLELARRTYLRPQQIKLIKDPSDLNTFLYTWHRVAMKFNSLALAIKKIGILLYSKLEYVKKILVRQHVIKYSTLCNEKAARFFYSSLAETKL